MFPFGALFGSLLMNVVMAYGRKTAMIISDINAILGIFMTISSNLNILLLGRFICGISAGFYFKFF